MVASGRAAFTLIELLIVTSIILVLVAFSTPLFTQTFAGLELKESASNIGRLITLAQQAAVIEGRVYKVSFDFEAHTYRILGAPGQGMPGTGYSRMVGRFGELMHVPGAITITGTAREFLIYPDGHTDQMLVRLTTGDGRAMAVATSGILGSVSVTEEEGGRGTNR
ncbi:MAG: prepilin-type N-terminal cleavage/methylation domain-containing protein [Candidatus Omnitrophota bacterium]